MRPKPVSAMMIPFWKMNGAGNSIIVADMRETDGLISSAAALSLANTLPFDQLMEIRKSEKPAEDISIRILNIDGSEAQACGNGTRCVVAYLADADPKDSYKIRSVAGLLETNFENNGEITVDMGIPRFRWDQIPLE